MIWPPTLGKDSAKKDEIYRQIKGTVHPKMYLTLNFHYMEKKYLKLFKNIFSSKFGMT